MLEILQEIYHDVTGNDTSQITPKTKLNGELGISSFGKIQLICAVEDRFDISIPNRVLSSFKTVDDILKYLKKVQKS